MAPDILDSPQFTVLEGDGHLDDRDARASSPIGHLDLETVPVGRHGLISIFSSAVSE